MRLKLKGFLKNVKKSCRISKMRHPLPISVLIRHTYSTVGRVLIFSGGPLGVNHGLLNPAHGSILPPLLAIIYSAPIRPSLSGGNKQRHVKKKRFKEIFPPESFFVR